MNKKAIAILGVIFLLIAGTLAFLIYSKYKTNPSNKDIVDLVDKNKVKPSASSTPVSPPSTSSSSPVNNSPIDPGVSKIVRLTDDQVVSPALFFKGNGITYFDTNGQLFQNDLENTSSTLQLTRKRNLQIVQKSGITKISWPKNEFYFMAEVGSGAQKSLSVFNGNVGTYTDLPKQVTAYDWTPTGDKIYYIWVDNNKATLNIGDPDTKNWQQISELWETDDKISVSPDGVNILFYRTQTASSTNLINLTTPDGKIWRTLIKDGYNSGVLWSPDSEKFLFGKKDPASGQFNLWYYNLLTGEIKNLRLPTTVEKVVWGSDSKTIYVAVPKTGGVSNTGLTEDDFVKLDTELLTKQTYSTGGAKVDGRDLFLGKDNKSLFFKNNQDGSLYYLDLN